MTSVGLVLSVLVAPFLSIVFLFNDIFLIICVSLCGMKIRSISSSAHTITSIVAVDTPGFQNPATVSPGSEAGFEDLCHNYAQERLQLLFHDTHMTAQLNRYAQEHIEMNTEDGSGQVDEEEIQSPELLVDLLDRAPQSAVVRATASVTNLRDAGAVNSAADRRGFLWLLDDEALMSVSSTGEEELLDKLSAMYSDRESEKLFSRPVVTDSPKNRLVLHHAQGTNSVTYQLDGWLKAAREIPTARNAAYALTESNKFVASLSCSLNDLIVNCI